MKALVGFLFFMLFLAGFAFVNLKTMRASVPTVQELSATAWQPTNLNELTLSDETEMRLTFESDQELSGYAGCNRFFGTYELDGAKIALGELGSTRKACAESIMGLEQKFLAALRSTITIAHADDRIALRNEQGDTVIRFVAVAIRE